MKAEKHCPPSAPHAIRVEDVLWLPGCKCFHGLWADLLKAGLTPPGVVDAPPRRRGGYRWVDESGRFHSFAGPWNGFYSSTRKPSKSERREHEEAEKRKNELEKIARDLAGQAQSREEFRTKVWGSLLGYRRLVFWEMFDTDTRSFSNVGIPSSDSPWVFEVGEVEKELLEAFETIFEIVKTADLVHRPEFADRLKAKRAALTDSAFQTFMAGLRP